MILLQLFLSFLKVGAVSFGGGYGMISLIREEVISHGWLTEEAFLNFIAVSESTPGPLAVNMATFIGSSQGGFPGALIATVGVVLPAFIIMLIIAAVLKNLLKYAGVNAFLEGLRPCIAGLITATAVTMILSVVTGLKVIGNPIGFDWKAVVIFLAVAGGSLTYRRVTKHSLSPILLILVSAGLGIVLYGLI